MREIYKYTQIFRHVKGKLHSKRSLFCIFQMLCKPQLFLTLVCCYCKASIQGTDKNYTMEYTVTMSCIKKKKKIGKRNNSTSRRRWEGLQIFWFKVTLDVKAGSGAGNRSCSSINGKQKTWSIFHPQEKMLISKWYNGWHLHTKPKHSFLQLCNILLPQPFHTILLLFCFLTWPIKTEIP